MLCLGNERQANIRYHEDMTTEPENKSESFIHFQQNMCQHFMDIEKVIDVSFCMILACITLAIIDDRRCILPVRIDGEGGHKLHYQ